ncbi:SEL1-like repeat protein [Commensalibacter nepenthis]|uniref:Sel1 repeat family protein n=1 Tax=Commensalibacter nepenthis TaxID=3043872 RepID=A0ABT6QAD9_9PROT|nr:hypothetical protein [Commensalibacter sp. TBRC 10068]MDI2113722.1 hypothetical protein [Commensalibacter sp. TBRC 10068]
MSSQLKILAAAPGEAVIVVVGQAAQYGTVLTISFPQFSSIASQKVLQQFVEGDNLLLTIDADSLGDILEPDSPYQIKIPELDCLATVIWPEIIGKRGNSKGVINTASNPLKTTQIIKEQEKIEEPDILPQEDQPEPSEPIVEEEAPLIHEEPKKSTSKQIIAAIITIIVITGAGGGIWYMKHQQSQPEVKKEQVVKKEEPKKEQPKVPEVAKTQPPAPPPKPEPSLAETLQKMPVPDVINKAPNTAMITKEGERRLAVKQYDDGVLLLENAASKGDTVAMLKLGLLYSPVDFKEGGAIPSPDMREAARYFQKAVENGSKEAAAPRAALKEWLIKKAESGDDMARLTIKDFWK